MQYRDILVIIDEDEAALGCLSAAVLVAKTSKATLVGAFLKQPFVYPYIGADFGAYVPSDVIQSLADDHAVAQTKAIHAAKKRFETATLAAGLTGEWTEIDASLDAELLSRARCCDLLVLPKSGFPKLGLSAAQLVINVGGPVLLVPPLTAVQSLGHKVLLAWNDSRESANALRGAWPMIHSSTEMQVVCVGPDKTQALRQHLHRHQITANVIVHPQKDLDAEVWVDSQAKAMGADMLIMGLYGHNRLQEFILGGVSRAMLKDDDPNILLVAH